MKNSEIEEKIREGALRVRVIIEIVGSPPEHVKNTVEGKLKEIEDNFEVIEKELAEPQKVSDKFHSSFLESELLFPDLSTLIGFIFDYMPSSVEIMEPEEITEDTQQLTEILNDLAVKLHQHSEAIIRLKAMNALLDKKVEKKD